MNLINRCHWFSKTTILLIVMIVVIDSCTTFLNVVNLFYKTCFIQLLIIIVQVINKDKIDKCCVKRTIFNY